VLVHLVADVVEDVELGLGREERGVGDAGRGEELLGLLGHLARVAGVDLAVAGVVDVEDHDERALDAERVDVGRGDGPVEELADGEELLVDGGRGDVEVLLHPGQVGEPDIEELDVGVLDEREHLG
jgi:hypothetical protein